MTRRACLAGLVGLYLAGPVLAQAPAGGEFQVNAYTTNGQYFPSVSVDPSGDFVVAWDGYGLDGHARGVVVRRFGSSGTAKGPEFVANAYTTGRQGSPAVATRADGGFVVVWEALGQDGSSYGIRGRRFDAQGAPLGGELAVNAYTDGTQWNPVVASNPDGRFAVAWVSQGQDGDGDGVWAHMYDATGSELGPAFRVSINTAGHQTAPDAGMDAVGNVRFVYQSPGEDGWDSAIVYRRFNYFGGPAGNFIVNTSTIGYQQYPSIAVNASGAFVIAWVSAFYDGSGSGIFARVFDSAGSALGPDFQVNTYTTGTQGRPDVALDDAGSFVVTWTSYGQDGSHNGVFGQGFDATGAPVGGEFRVNTYTTSYQSAPTAGASVDGDFVVAWSGTGGGDGYGVFGQRYGDLIFQDGVESGGLSRWSSSSTDGGDLAAAPGAGLAGTAYGLRAFVDDTVTLLVQDDSPAAESRYRARFYLDPDTLDPGEASGHRRVRVFIAFNGSSQRLFTVVLRRIAGAYSVLGRVRRDDGTRAETGFFAIGNAPHWLEFDWQKAGAPGTLDGRFEMRIDDAVVSTLTGIDNDATGGVEFARLGLMVVKSGASGTIVFDQFESRRERAIGAEWP